MLVLIKHDEARNHHEYVKAQDQKHVLFHLDWNLATAFVLAEVLENEVVLVNIVLYIKEETCEN